MIFALLSSLGAALILSMVFELLHQLIPSKCRYLSKRDMATVWWCVIGLLLFLGFPYAWLLFLPGIAISISHIHLSERLCRRANIRDVVLNLPDAVKAVWHGLFAETL